MVIRNIQIVANEYGPGMNKNSQRVRFFMTDIATEEIHDEYELMSRRQSTNSTLLVGRTLTQLKEKPNTLGQPEP
jgi:hypothetical protein